MRLRQRRSVNLFEAEILPIDGSDPDDHGQQRQPKGEHGRRLYFHVKRPQEYGGNVKGHCNGVQLHRSGMLIIHDFEERGVKTRTHMAHGTWFDLVTEPPRGEI